MDVHLLHHTVPFSQYFSSNSIPSSPKFSLRNILKMAYLEPKVMENFVVGKMFNQYPKMIAVLLGGSVVYRYANNGASLSAPDWDGALLMATKLDIFDLVNDNRQTLLDMFEISQEEWPELRMPHPSELSWHDFDAVRFVGYTHSGIRKSVKILSMEYFSESRNSLNLLSFKDCRIFESYSAGNQMTRYRIHQATKLEDGLLIHHDQWLFSADPISCEHGLNVAHTTFGVTADLLMTDSGYTEKMQARS